MTKDLTQGKITPLLVKFTIPLLFGNIFQLMYNSVDSLAVQYYAKPEIVAIVPPNCFMPRPNVGSAVIRLTRHKEVPVQVNDEKLMFKIIRASFNQRRKTLANGLNNAPDIHLSKEVIQESIEELGVPVTIRGEALTLQQFAQLSNIIGSRI